MLPDHGRDKSFALQLQDVHRRLRKKVGELRQAVIDGVPASGHVDTSLGEHCLTFCAALERHHEAEDGQLFPQLRKERPDLSDVIDKLSEDHQLIAALLTRLREVGQKAESSSDSQEFVREIDGIMAIMDSHFAFEERRIADAIDGTADGPWAVTVFSGT